MKHLFQGGRRKVAAVMAIALVASLSQVAPSNAAKHLTKNNLTILISEKDTSWCTQDSPGFDQVAIKNAVAETLTIRNASGRIVPYLAKSVTPSNGFKTWDITLREGIFFHDGEELTAGTVISNMAASIGLNPLITPSLPAVAYVDFFGFTSKTAAAAGAEFAAKVVATGKYSVRFNIPLPRPDLPSLLYSNGRPPLLSTKTLNSPACGRTVAAGTGPFKVKSKGVDEFNTVLEANPNYWRKAADGSKLPKAQTVTFKVVQDSAQRANAMVQGSADMAVFGWTNGSQLNRLKKIKSVGLIQEAQDTHSSIHFNTMAAPFNNKNARLAFSNAIDRVGLVQVMSLGNALAANSFGAPYHDYYVKDSGVELRANPKKAKEYMAAYKADTGKDLEILFPIDDTVDGLKTVNVMKRQLEKVGIKVTLMAPVTSTQYILRGFGLGQQLSWFSVIASRDSSFASLFSTNTDLELSGFRFTDPTLAQSFVDARAANKSAGYKKGAKTIHDEAYWIPIATYGNFLAVQKNISGVGATRLPNGASREVLGRAGWDFASVTVGG